MCIGLPLQVVCAEEHSAWCEAWADGARQHQNVDMRLVGPQPLGTWVLVFQGAARRVLSAEEASQALAARQALAAVLQGEGGAGTQEALDHLFADLVGHAPQLPAHLRVAATDNEPVAPIQPWGSHHDRPDRSA